MTTFQKGQHIYFIGIGGISTPQDDLKAFFG